MKNITRNSKGQYIYHASFWGKMKYNLKRAFHYVKLGTYATAFGAICFFAGQFSTSTTLYAADPVQPATINFPIMDKVATCESHGKQFLANGVLVKHANNDGSVDFGKYEINTRWEAKAVSLGYNIYEEKGNYDMAMYLFTNYGTEPWSSSKSCWIKL